LPFDPLTVKILVVVGVTAEDPPLIVNELAPEGVIVNVSPLQIEPLFTEITGPCITFTTDTAVLLEAHPWLLTPVTEYEVDWKGVTVALPEENP
jgi:hypothetical protein